MIRKYCDIFIIIILWIISGISIHKFIFSQYHIDFQNYLGYSLLLAITILKFLNISKFKTFLGIFLVLGSINLLKFTYWTTIFFFEINHIDSEQNEQIIGIQPISLTLLILFVIVYYPNIRKRINQILDENPKIIHERINKIFDKYYIELKNEQDDKLNEIISNRKIYQSDYVNAAYRILNERIK